MNQHLHIVCFDVPWPADYGGAIDMLYRIKALHQAGIKIHLHYFSYNHRGNPNELNQFCETINIYERKKGWKGLSLSVPYIINSRINPLLIQNINKDDYPVLLEGVHCTGIISKLNKNKNIVVRLHNDESVYYKGLAKSTNNIFKKIYFLFESHLLKKYQQTLPTQCTYTCITEKDTSNFIDNYGLKNCFLLPAFVPYNEIHGLEGIGNFCLYHGNLSVPENEKAVRWLLKFVFSKIKVPFVIAGKNPSPKLEKWAHLYQNTCLVANPGESELNDLIRKAHINILPSFNSTGIKFKLLHALFQGRHCVVNNEMVDGTSLEQACHIGTTANAIASIIVQLQHTPFTSEEVNLRKKLLANRYDMDRNARQLIAYLW